MKNTLENPYSRNGTQFTGDQNAPYLCNKNLQGLFYGMLDMMFCDGSLSFCFFSSGCTVQKLYTCYNNMFMLNIMIPNIMKGFGHGQWNRSS